MRGISAKAAISQWYFLNPERSILHDADCNVVLHSPHLDSVFRRQQ